MVLSNPLKQTVLQGYETELKVILEEGDITFILWAHRRICGPILKVQPLIGLLPVLLSLQQWRFSSFLWWCA